MCLQTNRVRVRDHPSIECALLPCNNQASTIQAYDTDGSSSSRSFLGYNTHSIRIGQLLANAVHHQFVGLTIAQPPYSHERMLSRLYTNVRFFRRSPSSLLFPLLLSIKVERVKVKLSAFSLVSQPNSSFTTTTTINSFYKERLHQAPPLAPDNFLGAHDLMNAPTESARRGRLSRESKRPSRPKNSCGGRRKKKEKKAPG